jgi:hypothetical protein
MADNEWQNERPPDWPPEINITNFTGLPETIEEMLCRYSHFFEAGATAMLEARDKWLVEKMDEIIDNCSAIGSGCDCKHYSQCDDMPMTRTCKAWQNFKKEISHDR